MNRVSIVLAALLSGCATTQSAQSPPPVANSTQAVSAPVERKPVKLVVKDERVGTDGRLANQLEGYVRNKLEKLGVQVDQTATQIFEVNAMPPSGRCAVAGGRVFSAGGEAFAFPVTEQRCAAGPANMLMAADPLTAAVAAAYRLVTQVDAPDRSDFQNAVDSLVTRLVLKVR